MEHSVRNTVLARPVAPPAPGTESGRHGQGVVRGRRWGERPGEQVDVARILAANRKRVRVLCPGARWAGIIVKLDVSGRDGAQWCSEVNTTRSRIGEFNLFICSLEWHCH